MDLTRTPYPTREQMAQAPIGTTFVYRRALIFAPDPLWFAVAKLGADRWVRAQARASLDAALAVMRGNSRHPQDCIVDDCSSAVMCKRLDAKEVEADGAAEHVGLHVGQLPAAQLPVLPAPNRPDAAAIAAAFSHARTPEGAQALAAELARLKPKKGASRAELDRLDEALHGEHPELIQLFAWSNGHRRLDIGTVSSVLETNDHLERDGLFVLNDNENGDFWGIVTSGPLKGALFFDDYDLRDPPADAVRANGLLDLVKQAAARSQAR